MVIALDKGVPVGYMMYGAGIHVLCVGILAQEKRLLGVLPKTRPVAQKRVRGCHSRYHTQFEAPAI